MTSVLKYYNGICYVSYDTFAFETNEQPSLSFLYESLDYDSSREKNYFVINSTRKLLDADQSSSCQEYCKNFINAHDFYVYAYNEKNIFTGKVLKSEAEKKNLKFTINNKPAFPVSKWNKSENIWEEVLIIVKQDGTVVRHPVNYCDQCVLFLTQKEINDLPNINDYDDDYHKYDPEKHEWFVTGNEYDDLQRNLIYRVRMMFDTVRWVKAFGHYVPEYERYGWSIEKTEAHNWLVNENSTTPYIDGILEGLGDLAPTKKEYIAGIIKNSSNDVYKTLGLIHGKMNRYIYKLKNAGNIEELKTLEKEIDSLKLE